MTPVIAICGPGRSGKDTAAAALAEALGVTYNRSTSEAACDVVWEQWGKDAKVVVRNGQDNGNLIEVNRYTTKKEMFADRANHRARWYKIILAYNSNDAKLYYDMVDAGETIICGIRCAKELKQVQQLRLIDLAIWIERDGCEEEVCTVTAGDCDLSIINNSTLGEFRWKVTNLGKLLKASYNQLHAHRL